jgi:hypothetical protein
MQNLFVSETTDPNLDESLIDQSSMMDINKEDEEIESDFPLREKDHGGGRTTVSERQSLQRRNSGGAQMAPVPATHSTSDYKQARNALLNDIVPMESNGTSKSKPLFISTLSLIFNTYRLSVQNLLLLLLPLLLLHLL